MLTGNGLSVGLNKEFALPNITKRFYNRLEPVHRSFIDHHMKQLEKEMYVQTNFEEAIASIEQVYDSLKNYYDFLIGNPNGQTFMDAYDLKSTGIRDHIGSVRNIIFEYTASILDLIDGHVHWNEIGNKLSGFIDWLTQTIETSKQVDLFTLNFDLLLETILLETIGPERFMDFHVQRGTWDLIDENKYEFSPDLALQLYGDRKVRLHHLHGSLSSFQEINTGKIFKITTEALRLNEVYDHIFNYDIIPSIVTGGGKSVKVQNNPFNFYYNELKRKLVNEAQCCSELYIIGYSFRDDHINKAISTRLKYERKRKDAIPLNQFVIVDFKSGQEEKREFIDHINKVLEFGPRMKNKFVYDDPRIVFEGADNISRYLKNGNIDK